MATLFVKCSILHQSHDMEVSKRYGVSMFPLTCKWIKKIYHIYKIRYYSAFKNEDFVICENRSTWRTLYWIKISKNQAYCHDLIHMWNIKSEITEAEGRRAVIRGWGQRGSIKGIMNNEVVSVRQEETALEPWCTAWSYACAGNLLIQ